MSNEQDIVQHFCEPSNTLFLCVLWQMLLEKDEIQPTAYKVRKYQIVEGWGYLGIREN